MASKRAAGTTVNDVTDLVAAIASKKKDVALGPGVYALPAALAIGGPLRLRGAGATETVLLAPAGEPAVDIRSSDVSLSGLCIRARRGPSRKRPPAKSGLVVARKAGADLTDCQIAGASEGMGLAALETRIVQLVAAALGGAEVDTSWEEPTGVGVSVVDRGSIHIGRTRVFGFDVGIETHDAATAEIERCELTNNTKGAQQGSKGVMRITGTTLRDNGDVGVDVSAGRAQIVGSQATAQGNHGFSLSGAKASLHLRECVASDNGLMGVRILAGTSSIEGSVAKGNGQAGIWIMGGRSSLLGNQCSGQGSGIRVEAGEAALTENTCEGNLVGIFVGRKGKVTLDRNVTRANDEEGVAKASGAVVRIEGETSAKPAPRSKRRASAKKRV